MTAAAPIRVVTRALAEMQTAILAEGLRLTKGDVERFAILSLIVRLTPPLDDSVMRRATSVASLAQSLSVPYETVRRHVIRLAADGLCYRGSDGIKAFRSEDQPPALRHVWGIAHQAMIKFIERLDEGTVSLPRDRHSPTYSQEHGVMAAVDLMLTVVDGNSTVHGTWSQLVIFSAVLAKSHEKLIACSTASSIYRDETRPVPSEFRKSVRASTISTLLSVSETTVRRQMKAMVQDGRLTRTDSGFEVSEMWLNQPHCLDISRRTNANVKRILEQLAARNFPFDCPSSARLSG